MRKLMIIFLVLLFVGCSTILYDEGDMFVQSIYFTQGISIIDVEEMQIESKDELVEYYVNDVTAYIDWRGDLKYKWYGLEIQGHSLEELSIVYIEPLSNNKPILDKEIYKLGMPIALDCGDCNDYYSYYGYHPNRQPVILIRGKPEWVDSSYKCFTILPVANSAAENNLDFTYTLIEKTKN